ncbi:MULTISPECIES: maleylpyruvate isomerase family mycothiol-dependent enzyme [Prauserella salsuginis group]|uniref:Maleylpyruvate isomerase family mycothiol-dependent enzyme n=1 Tax=Prauserella salsuginis TaxID=387889 RepID=A0ABW6GC07_9PSEU|nr:MULTISPECIES: maleylpyruvate isomerase family mycothiol-dependent enzyme [Prauserella salsuginis group]MCR3722303.1 TIGR03083 family protein [Prauserella flava]MCR3736301.1 TIGR03083 family protein [Prauserella salsuginis]
MTTTTGFDKDAITGALAAQWESLDALLASLPAAAWDRTSALPGWTVRDVVAHVIGTEASLLGEQTPDPDIDVTELPHVRNEIAAFNERWVQSMRDWDAPRMLDRFRDVVSRRGEALRAMTQEDFDAPSWTPVGRGTYGRFMRIRVFDTWLHEQDVRDAVGLPGHEAGPCAEQSFDELAESLGFVIGKRAAAPDGAGVTLELTGPLRRTVHVAVDGRAAVVPELPGPATATLRLEAGLFARLAGGRVAAEDRLSDVEYSGDTELGRRIVRNLAFTI